MERFVTRNQIAEMLGISRQRVRALELEGKLPEPDGIHGDRPLWRIETAERLVRERRADLGE